MEVILCSKIFSVLLPGGFKADSGEVLKPKMSSQKCHCTLLPFIIFSTLVSSGWQCAWAS